MKPEWIEYTGSDEQIAEMDDTGSFIIKANGVESHVMHHIDERGLLVECDEYLICNRHKYAKLIQRWSMTGQPVWVRIPVSYERYGYCYITYGATTTPDWNITGAEYSFTPFGEEV